MPLGHAHDFQRQRSRLADGSRIWVWLCYCGEVGYEVSA